MASPESNPNPVRATLTDYHGKAMIRLEFHYDGTIIQKIRTIRGRIWSATHRSWYVPDTKENQRRFGLSAFEQGPDVGGEVQGGLPFQSVCQSLLNRMRDKIILRALSKYTLKTYMNHIKLYLAEIGKTVNPLDMTRRDIEQYLLNRHERNPTSESERNCHINAIKFLYEQVLGRERMLFYLPRPEKPQQLPKVLGEHELERNSNRSAQTIFNRAVKAAGITKEVTFHALRHSYATHLLEKGVDIKYIKELLGHFDIKTTERYLHVAREKLVHIQSPLDYLDRGI